MSWATVIITLILSAFFSGMEIAFISANKLKVEVDKKKGLFSARILAEFIKKPSAVLGTLLLGNNISLVVYGIAMAKILESQIIRITGNNSEYFVLLIQTVLSTVLILVAAEFIPKALFRINPNLILSIFAVPIRVIYWLLYPIVHFFIFLSESMLKNIFKIKITKEEYSFSPIDLNNYLEEFSSDEQNIEEKDKLDEIQIFKNAMEFTDTRLRECLVPRTEIAAVDIKDSIENLKKMFIETGFSKILVFRENIDDIIGYIHSSDIFKSPANIEAVLRVIPFFPESSLAKDVLSQLINEHISVGVVVDEFGGTEGMVTMEDIIEEIFGEIEDEFDEDELVETQLEDGILLVSARHEIDYLNNTYALNLPVSEEYETLGGLIIDVHKSIPVKGDRIHVNENLFVIEHATDTRIELVKVIRR